MPIMFHQELSPQRGTPEMPFLAVFKGFLRAEREAQAKPKLNHHIILKFYLLVPEASDLFRHPVVDDPVASLCSSSILPADLDKLPKDSSDRKVEQGLRKSLRQQ